MDDKKTEVNFKSCTAEKLSPPSIFEIKNRNLKSKIGIPNSEFKDTDLLYSLDPSTIKPFSLDGKIYECVVNLNDIVVGKKTVESDIYDGDTLYVIILDNAIPRKYRVRMLGYDSPERKPLKIKENRELEKKAAMKCRDLLSNFLKGKKLEVKFGKYDKYGGRILAELFTIVDEEKISVNDWMIDNNYGKCYDGGKKGTWTIDELQILADLEI